MNMATMTLLIAMDSKRSEGDANLTPAPSSVGEGMKSRSTDVSSSCSVIVTPSGSAVCVGVGAKVRAPHCTSVPDNVEVQESSVGPV